MKKKQTTDSNQGTDIGLSRTASVKIYRFLNFVIGYLKFILRIGFRGYLAVVILS
jgi:hypothetical protein